MSRSGAVKRKHCSISADPRSSCLANPADGVRRMTSSSKPAEAWKRRESWGTRWRPQQKAGAPQPDRLRGGGSGLPPTKQGQAVASLDIEKPFVITALAPFRHRLFGTIWL